MTVGTKWYKCDLHLHTPASKCFKDQTITPEQWVQAALERGLNCVAVTDHNTGAWIDKIKVAAEGTGLVVYPGVELTCSDAKVHLLILFDTEKGTTEIEDFITLSGIVREKFGEQDAHSPKSTEDIFKLALDKKAICIPAHIDEFNGISEIAHNPRLTFLDHKDLLGVQVVHELMTKPEKEYHAAKIANLEHLNRYYRLGEQQIAEKKWKVNEERMKNWRQAVLQSQEKNKAILTFSDNPHEEKDSQHGIWGIGTRYSWIKMDQNPGLEGLRQALLLHKFRIRNDFECPNYQKPYNRPEVLIRSLRISDTQISEPLIPLEVQFSPQMTTIIGGRGSGKSTVLQALRGIFGKQKELNSLEIVKSDFDRFFKVQDKTRYGILQNNCSFVAEIEREEVIYHLVYTIQSGVAKVELSRNLATGEKEMIPNFEDFLHLLDFDIFSQKQIYEVATNLNSLREKIDESDEQLVALKKELGSKKDEYKQKSTEIRTLQHKVSHKGQLAADISDLENKISRYNESSLEEYIKNLQVFESENSALERYFERLEEKGLGFHNLIDNLDLPVLDKLVDPSSSWEPVFQPFVQELENAVLDIKSRIKLLEETYLTAIQKLKNEITVSNWAIEKNNLSEEYQKRKKLLQDAGIDEASKIEEIMSILNHKQKEWVEILEIERLIIKKQADQEQIKTEFFQVRQQLTLRRQIFLKELLQGRNVKAKVARCRDMADLEKQIRHHLGASGSVFVNDVRQLIEMWAQGTPEESNQVFNQHLTSLRQGLNRGSWDGKFINKVKALQNESFDEFDLLFPEDDIQIEYKNGAGEWKPISTASAGQKTAAILTLILSHGKKPLLLDQPEDDLDNRLIYDLVVDQLRISKETRQIIVVTHNANIPVNGDSEHIIVMDAESKYIKPLATGCIEEQAIKSAICEIMEGGTEAFNMRSERYKNL